MYILGYNLGLTSITVFITIIQSAENEISEKTEEKNLVKSPTPKQHSKNKKTLIFGSLPF